MESNNDQIDASSFSPNPRQQNEDSSSTNPPSTRSSSVGSAHQLSDRGFSDSYLNYSSNESESDQESDIEVINHLIRRQINVIYDGSSSDSDEFVEAYSCNKRNMDRTSELPDPDPDTSNLDKSDLRQLTLLHSGLIHCPSLQMPSLPAVVASRQIGSLSTSVPRYSSPNFTKSYKCLLTGKYLPRKMVKLDHYPSKTFCGFYSKEGDMFLTACQDYNIRIYDTKNDSFRLMNTVWARDVGWSILDSDMSPDGRHFVYSSWSESLHICNVHGEEVHEALALQPNDRLFCIFSLRFSQDGREIIGGANDECIYIFDRETNMRTHRIPSHEEDVNSVAFADGSSQILYSGGDDALVKVWDRRTLSDSNPKPVGTFVGHIDGITYIDPKGDGRHLISNCKDQTIKLWDMRVFSPSSEVDNSRRIIPKSDWDYRWQALPKKLVQNNKKKLDGDTSLMTYRGHSVLQTLIRCHFSPSFTTGQRYIYTGCASGRMIIYDVLTGEIVRSFNGHQGCVRDVSWHPYLPEIISSSWDGSVIKWYFSDESDFLCDDGSRSQFNVKRSKRISERSKRLEDIPL
ncbi:DDB1- and CUL4-associated factor 11 isoform X2 [Tetranychus urticae]|uniref:DDB1- and CUL4-associated factor 11 isoform X2 n=1 Tax=Tetranychus urticae TaxID=32264 RepID=UPI00077BC5CD|nr:DDB1- and CUL4-associated factor 11 isoform X2 [Tetranychus urticae]